MNARTVMTHAPMQEESAHVLSLRAALNVATDARRAAEADVRAHVPGAHDAHSAADRAEMDAYLALFDARHVSDEEWLASPSVLASGVSLVKRGLVAPGTRRVRVPEFILAGRRAASVDRAIATGPIGVGPALERNDLRALSLTFDVMARLNH